MWTTLFRLSLMLFTCDFHRDRIVAAEPIRLNAELVSSDYEQHSRTDTRGQPEGWTENLTEPVGKWRNNDGALEPKWRDGDSIPMLPFTQISRYSNEKTDSVEEADNPRRRGTNRRVNNGRDNYLRPRKNPRLSYVDYEDREPAGSSRGQQVRKEISPRKRNRLRSGENAAAYEEPSNRKEEAVVKDSTESAEAPWQRETLQTRPSNDYGYEFSDEEYLKPKPRKRRPPQNYEFALSKNETSADVEGTDSNDKKKNSWSRAGEQMDRSDARKDGQTPQSNAVELKSLLKMQQEEGLSLSEILQRRNLTLNDLLKGKADAINALKMKDAEENEYYGGEAAETLPNIFAKLSTTRRPQWPTSTEAAKAKSYRKDDEFVFSINPVNLRLLRKNRTNATGSSSSNANTISEMYSAADNANDGKISIPFGVAIAQGEVAVTTSVPVATDSAELMQADEAAAKSRNGGEIKTLDLDEDEIMEFSDFTDYKKGRTGGSPVWLMMKEEQANSEPPVESSKGRLEDVGSTLSIEKILSPTESSESAKNSSIHSETGKQPDRKDKLPVEIQRTAEHFKEDDNASSETEYQEDGPRMIYEVEYGTQVSSATDESGVKESVQHEIKTEFDVASPDLNSTEENRRSYPRNHQIMEEGDNRAAKNHQDIDATEKDVSEVEPEARAEIFELFSSGSAGKRLERLLKSRNMSLEELIALRQRGSSKVHLAEVSRIKAQKSNNEDMSNLRETTTLSFKGKIDPSLTGAIGNRDENYNGGLDNYLSQTTENITNTASTSGTIYVVQSDEVTTELSPRDLEPEISNKNPETDEKEDIKENHRTVHIVDLLTTFDSLPLPKDVRDFTNEYNDEHQRKLPVHSNNLGVMFINNDAEAIYENETTDVTRSGFVKEVIKQEPSSINIQTEYNTVGDDEGNSENGRTLSKVKPSIIASGAILGVTLVVFLAIFIVCKIQQKQKYRYRSTFSRAVFQGPIMAARKLSNSSSLSNVMVNVVATSTAKRPERNEIQEPATDIDSKSDIDNDSLDANDSWETIPDYMK